MLKRFLIPSAVALVAIASACGDNSSTPTSPSATNPAVGGTAAYPDGATLKVTQPTLVSPANNSTTERFGEPLVIGASTGKFAPIDGIVHRYEVVDPANRVVMSEVVNGTSFTPKALEPNTTYRWRARGEALGSAGPWSDYWSFRTPDKPQGYIREGEIFDPLTEGVSVGAVSGPVEWIPGVGVKLLDFTSRITYELPATLQEGEFSMLVSGIDEGSAGDKSKVMSMQEGYDDLITNDYRFTIEYRGRDYTIPGTVAWRVITGEGDDEEQIHDAQRRQVEMTDSQVYLWRITWRTGQATLEIREGGSTGRVIYSYVLGTGDRPYRPVPHVIHVGAPVGRSGTESATIPGLIARGVWVSASPRPAFADQ